jgi:hypothetical protein
MSKDLTHKKVAGEERSVTIRSGKGDSYDDMKSKLIQILSSPDVWVRSYEIEKTRKPTHNQYDIKIDFVHVLEEIDLNNDTRGVVERLHKDQVTGKTTKQIKGQV